MEKARKRIENSFIAIGELTFRRKWILLLVIFLVTALAMVQLPKLRVDTSNESFFHKNDPTLLQYDKFLDEFDRDEVIVVGIKTDKVFTSSFLTRLAQLHDALEKNTPYLDEIISLKNVVNVRGEKDELIVEDLLDKWPKAPEEYKALEQTVEHHPVYPNLLIAKDQAFVSIIIRPLIYSSDNSSENLLAGFDETQSPQTKRQKLTPEQIHELIDSIRTTIAQFDGPDFKTYLAGESVVTDDVMQALNADIPFFTTLAIILISTFLFILYRRVSGVLLPLLTVVMSLLATLGIMAASGVAFTVFTQVLPSFLLAVGIGDSVHLLTIFYRRFNETQDKKASMKYALGHAGLAMLMTTVTTAGGLLSFSAAEMAPIGELGIFGALGVFLALLYTIFFLPTMIAVLPIKAKAHHSQNRTNAAIDRFLIRCADLATIRPGVTILVFLIITIVALIGITQLRFHYDTVEWFPDDQPVKQATLVVDKAMKGSMNVEIILDTGKPDGIKDIIFLNKMDELQRRLGSLKYEDMAVGKSYSVRETIKLINQALNENDKKYYRLPDSSEAAAQELLLFENSGGDELERQLNSDFSKARITLTLPWTSAESYVGFLAKIDRQIDAVFGASNPHYITGMVTLYTRTSEAAIKSMTQSYIIAFFVIATLMAILLWSFRVGMVSMLPNLFPIFVALGFMGLAGLPLDLSSILVGSIAIGLSVDDTIHFMHHFRRYYSRTQDAREAIHQTLSTAGRAMLFTSIVLALGFLIFTLSKMNNIDSFGMVTASAVILALFADILLAPALMVFLTRYESFRRCL